MAGGRRAVRTAARPPAVAGLFYPADPRVLATQVDQLLDAVDVPANDVLAPAYVVPHAGYQYSGPTAAHVYARLRHHASEVSRVVVAGPAHRVPVEGCVVSGAREWLTPLGEVPVDQRVDALVANGYAVFDDLPHAPEHSIEVQLPFLQRTVGEVPLVPIVVGPSGVDDVAAALSAAAEPDPAGTVVLCSTDLSHYLPDEQARQRDGETLRAVGDLAPERIGEGDACGVFALRGLVGLARRVGLEPWLLDYATSADTTGDPTRVVGYAAVAFAPR
ncbi:AmmeMemoRadiSam system protein B [Planosporangium mesophilum]|uniref:MEMO1 family protein Pme01_19400 n=1 Tax=Planosporangium mesophilum TaxID=689768 RepID=A0A8J3T9I3_9ACTN|nr:AmmeMemoRadiSam system protein B [Planosporangium mesophilum]NJC82291.1 AmmeMemoRadiSam system protein B [Planosporangium mesophilum]GII22343.1 MEMO1 family protein [Planosporangium mesophilum]